MEILTPVLPQFNLENGTHLYLWLSKRRLILIKWYLYWFLPLNHTKCISIIVFTHSKPELCKTSDFWQLGRREEWGVQKQRERMTGGVIMYTLNGVAESGFIWTMGPIRTTPAKSLGLSQAVRMDIAPPWERKSTDYIIYKWTGNWIWEKVFTCFNFSQPNDVLKEAVMF